MYPDGNARSALRAATAHYHDRVDRVFSGANLGEVGSYGRFLLAQAAGYLPIEAALTCGGVGRTMPDWDARQRGGLLLADLADLELAPPDCVREIIFGEEAAVLGALYVLEGSRLGGALLKRSVPPTFPSRFLGGGDSAAWRRLLAVLDERLDTDAKRAIAIEAASAVFTLFEVSGQRYLAQDQSGARRGLD